jgi:hypothetical protein
MGPAKVAQMVEVLNGLTARDALCLSVGCMLTVLDEAPSDEERRQSLDGCIDLLKARCARSFGASNDPFPKFNRRGTQIFLLRSQWFD